jgi:hypothetical protein
MLAAIREGRNLETVARLVANAYGNFPRTG